ncbi:hypothetical protein ACRAOJ_07395 [Campylobacter majalis]
MSSNCRYRNNKLKIANSFCNKNDYKRLFNNLDRALSSASAC